MTGGKKKADNMTNYKNEVRTVYYFSDKAKDVFLNAVGSSLPDDVKRDFDINFGYYKLKDNSLIINDKIKYTFKTKTQFLKVAHKINLINTVQLLKQYSCITICRDFHGYDSCGNGVYMLRLFGANTKQNRILNITSLIATMRACLGFSAVMRGGCLIGDDCDHVYIQKMLADYDIQATT